MVAYARQGQPVDLKRLTAARDWSYKKLQGFRDVRLKIAQQIAGSNYGGVISSWDVDKKCVPYNKLETAYTTFSRQLVANNPQVMISTFNPDQFVRAKLLEAGVNRRLQDMRWKNTLSSLAQDATIQLAVVKVCRREDEIYLDVVDLDDFVCDMAARSFEYCTFIGHRLRLPLAEVQASDFYDPAVTAQLTKDEVTNNNDGGDSKINSIGVGNTGTDQAEPIDMVTLWEIYLPLENALVTLAEDKGDLPPLRYETWRGPAVGPFLVCGLDRLSGNIMPLSPLLQLLDLHMAVAELSRKNIADAVKFKRNTAVASGGAEDADNLNKATHGHAVKVDNIGGLKEVISRGLHPPNLAAQLAFEEMFSKQGHNLDVIAGLSSEADTLGQENLLSQASNRTVTAWQERFRDFVGEIARAVAWHVWDLAGVNEFGDPQVVVPYAVGSQTVPVPLVAEGSFDDFDFQLNPFSLQENTPQSEAAFLRDFAMNIWPMLSAQAPMSGLGLDVEEFVHLYARGNNKPGLNRSVRPMPNPLAMLAEQGGMQPGMQPGMGMAGGAPTPKPAQTERKYTRISKGGKEAGKKAMMASLMKPEKTGAA